MTVLSCPVGHPVRDATVGEVVEALLGDGPAPDVTGECTVCGGSAVG